MSGLGPAPSAPATVPPSDGDPPVLEARKVSVPWRIPVGIVITLVLGGIFVGVPLLLIPFLVGYGIHAGSSVAVLAVLGALFAVLEGARFVAKPTTFYGPIWIASSATFLIWVLYLASNASVTITAISNVKIAVGYALLLYFLALVPALTLAAAVVTTVEDRRHPGERMPFDFPLRRWGRRRKAPQ